MISYDQHSSSCCFDEHCPHMSPTLREEEDSYGDFDGRTGFGRQATLSQWNPVRLICCFKNIQEFDAGKTGRKTRHDMKLSHMS